MEHEIPFGNSNRENGTTFLDFPLFLGIFQWDEPTKRVPFSGEPEIPEILSKWKAPLFTDTTAILNLLNLRSIMGCPGGTRSVFTLAFRANRELHWIFLGKKTIIITSKHGTTIFFCHYNFFVGKLQEKLARKARVNTERVYRIVLMPPGHPIILLKSNEFNMAAVSVKRFICQHCLKCKHCKFNTYPPLIWIMFTSSLVETPCRQLLFLVPLKL